MFEEGIERIIEYIKMNSGYADPEMIAPLVKSHMIFWQGFIDDIEIGELNGKSET